MSYKKIKRGYKQATPRHRVQSAVSSNAQDRAIEKRVRQASKLELGVDSDKTNGIIESWQKQ